MNTKTNDIRKTEFIALGIECLPRVSPSVTITAPLPTVINQTFLWWCTTVSWALWCARSVHSGRQFISSIIFIFTSFLFYSIFFLFRLQRKAEALLKVATKESQSPNIHPTLLFSLTLLSELRDLDKQGVISLPFPYSSHHACRPRGLHPRSFWLQ
jgi:hypothetical protein